MLDGHGETLHRLRSFRVLQPWNMPHHLRTAVCSPRSTLPSFRSLCANSLLPSTSPPITRFHALSYCPCLTVIPVNSRRARRWSARDLPPQAPRIARALSHRGTGSAPV